MFTIRFIAHIYFLGSHRFTTGISTLRIRATHVIEDILEDLPFVVLGLVGQWAVAVLLAYLFINNIMGCI